MVKRKSSQRKSATPRASWRGQLTFSLVSFPVEAFNAHSKTSSDIHFHQLHNKCHRRIQHRKVCPVHGEVANDEIVSGYEYAKDKYIEIQPEELDALRTESDRALKIDSFIAPTEVDPLYFDGRMYYVVPSGPAAVEPYTVILEAMRLKARYAICRLVLSGKEQIALLRSVDGIMHMAMLNYQAEMLAPAEIAKVVIPKANLKRQIRLAERLIHEWSLEDFDFATYKDTHRQQVKRLIAAKKEGRKVLPPDEPEAPPVVSLMQALKDSVEFNRKGRSQRKTA